MLNFTNRGGERARNIAVKIQFMSDEGLKGMKVMKNKLDIVDKKYFPLKTKFYETYEMAIINFATGYLWKITL